MKMKKEWLLLVSMVFVTIVLSLGLIRWFAPQLLGVPVDLQLVKVSEEIPPFYEIIFRTEDKDLHSKKFLPKHGLLNDPYTKIRAKSFFPEIWTHGPHDILGFRNRNVPNVSDIVVIGDSQTYGNNVILKDNWPNQMIQNLERKEPTLYNMATGGWGAVQYLDMFTKAKSFKPRVVVIAFYSGNDALESFQLAYNVERWASLRINSQISASEIPSLPKSDNWHVNFKDGFNATFTPRLRLLSNMDHPAVSTGYAIMEEVAHRISIKGGLYDIKVVFTIIPTKELVYAEKIRRDGIHPSETYSSLIRAEQKNLQKLASILSSLTNSAYVDLLSPLQQAALSPIPLYQSDGNGHPIAHGYSVIAKALASAIDKFLPYKPKGLLLVQFSATEEGIVLVNDEGVWGFDSEKTMKANGWLLDDVKTVTYRDIATSPLRGIITTVDPEYFGPVSVTMP